MKWSASLWLAGVAAALAAGGLGVACSSSGSPAGPASADAGGTPVSEDAGIPVGAPCTKDTDCPAPDECTTTVYTAGNPVYPTGICVAKCTPGGSQGLAFCGSDSIPGQGLCQPASGGASAICLPLCEVTPSGDVVGCEANDVCQVLGAQPPDGAGWCQPGCTSTSQCPTGSVCDPLLAACVATPLATTLPIGAPCSLTANPPPCNCVGSANEATGYCTAACVTGVSTCPLPGDAGAADDAGDAGAPPVGVAWVCSAGLNLVTGEDGGAIFTTQPPGLFGFCAPPCNTNDDCVSFAGHCSQGDPAAPAGFTGTCATGS